MNTAKLVKRDPVNRHTVTIKKPSNISVRREKWNRALSHPPINEAIEKRMNCTINRYPNCS
jgi:stalled ribosome rescue protein Dom34